MQPGPCHGWVCVCLGSGCTRVYLRRGHSWDLGIPRACLNSGPVIARTHAQPLLGCSHPALVYWFRDLPNPGYIRDPDIPAHRWTRGFGVGRYGEAPRKGSRQHARRLCQASCMRACRLQGPTALRRVALHQGSLGIPREKPSMFSSTRPVLRDTPSGGTQTKKLSMQVQIKTSKPVPRPGSPTETEIDGQLKSCEP
jgi:hypothetical protein